MWSSLQFVQSGNYTIENISKIILYPDAYLWFLWVLFWICVLFNLAQLIAAKCKINEMLIIGIFCVLLIALMVGAEIRVLGFQFLAYYFIFYTLGYCLHKFNWKFLNRWTCLVPLSLLWFFFAWGWTMHGLPSWIPAIPHVPSSLLQYEYRGFTALVAIVVLIGAAPKLLNGAGKLNKTICKLGIVSLGLYVVHLSLMSYIVDVIEVVMPAITTWPCVVMAFVIALAISYLVVWLLNKNRHTARIFLGKI